MNNDFEKGNILEFDRIGTTIVLGNIEYDSSLYALVCPFTNNKDGKIKADLKKLILLKNEKNDVQAVTNYNIISNVVPQILKKENINLE